MSGPRIGLIGKRGDAQIARLCKSVARRDAIALPFDLTEIPAHVTFHWQDNTMRFGDLDLDSLDGVYARTAHFPMPTFVPGVSRDRWEELSFPVRESGSLMNSIVWELARRMPVINPPGCYRFHGQKPHLYAELQRAGVPVPPFAVGCDLAAAAHFVDDHEQRVVIKPLMGGEVFLANLAFLKEHHEQLDRRPFLLQKRIVGRSYRAYVIEEQIVAAAEIVHGDVVDWRNDMREIVPVTLPQEGIVAAQRSIACQELVFGAVDMEQDEQGCWVIDVNPGPMFAGFEERSGLDIAGPLADCLLRRVRSCQPTRLARSSI